MASIKGEWFMQVIEPDGFEGPWVGPLPNAMTPEGLERIAALIAGIPSPYIACGGSGGEAFRKSVASIAQSSNVLRFMTSFAPSEGNGDHTYLSLYTDATSVTGSGTQINQLNQSFNKVDGQILNLECKLTIQQGV